MASVLKLIALLTVRCFYVVQKQKGVADAMIKAHEGVERGIASRDRNLIICTPLEQQNPTPQWSVRRRFVR
jgi:hypothetical protein